MDVCMKRLGEGDLGMVMGWRMRPDITRYMNTDPALTIEGQAAWFRRISQDSSQIQWLIHVQGRPVGMISLMGIDLANQRCSWGYYIAETDARSLQLAVYLEWNLYDYVFFKLKLHKLCHETFVLNKQVVRLHQMCGSRQDGVLREHVLKDGIYYDVAVGSILREEWVGKRKGLTYDRYIFE